MLGSIPIVSLDKIYFRDADGIFLDCTRLDKSKKLVSRKNPNSSKSVEEQIVDISKKLLEDGKREIVIADDVVFSGNVLRSLINLFEGCGIETVGVRSSIATEESYEYFNRVLPKGLMCGCLLGSEVIDQICERDFYFGIVQAGISSVRPDGKILKRPYFKPFGNPVERASIPKRFESIFSNNCLMRSMYLWKCIEDNTGRMINIEDMPEEIYGTKCEDRVLNTLRKGLIFYEKDTSRDNGERS